MFSYFPVIYSLKPHTKKEEPVQNRNQKKYTDYDVALLTAYQAIKQKYKENIKNTQYGRDNHKKIYNGYNLFSPKMMWVCFKLYKNHNLKAYKQNTKLELPEARSADQNSPVVSVHSRLRRRRSLCYAIAYTQKQKQKQHHHSGPERTVHLESHSLHLSCSSKTFLSSSFYEPEIDLLGSSK